ncbi:unnamed protein product [Merluccius merluccius]
MSKGTEYADGHNMEDWDFEEVMVETDVRGYLYEPQYSDEQLRAMEEQEAAEAAAATAETDDLPAADEEPAMARAGADWWCLCSHCAPMDTERVCLLPRIPAAIRQKYPAPDSQYCGHQEAEDAQDL